MPDQSISPTATAERECRRAVNLLIVAKDSAGSNPVVAAYVAAAHAVVSTCLALLDRGRT